MAGIREISKKCGLSVATVSHVINGTRQVSNKSRQLVMKAIEETGYKPNFAARMLRTQRSDTIAMLIPEVQQGMPTNVFFMDVLNGAKDYLQSVGLNLIVVTFSETDDKEENDLKNLHVLQNQWIDGFLIVPNLKRKRLWDEIIQRKTPFVMLDRLIKEIDCSGVYSDTYSISADVVDLLALNNRKKIGYIGGSKHSLTGSDRYKGYCEGLKRNGLAENESIVFTSEQLTVEEGEKCMQSLLSQDIDSVYIANNALAIGAVKCMQKKNISIPKDIGVVVFEDYEWMQIIQPPLTTVRQQPYRMGWQGAELLYKTLLDETFRDKISLHPEIIIRKSHGDISN